MRKGSQKKSEGKGKNGRQVKRKGEMKDRKRRRGKCEEEKEGGESTQIMGKGFMCL